MCAERWEKDMLALPGLDGLVGGEEKRLLAVGMDEQACSGFQPEADSEVQETGGGSMVQESMKFPECPRCTSQDVWRNGQNSAGNQQYRCRTCGRVYVLEPYLPNDIRLIADRMLRQGIKVPVIAEVLSGFISRRWLYERRKTLQSTGAAA